MRVKSAIRVVTEELMKLVYLHRYAASETLETVCLETLGQHFEVNLSINLKVELLVDLIELFHSEGLQ